MKKIIIVGENSMLGKAIGDELSLSNIVLYAGRTLTADIKVDLKDDTVSYSENCDVIIHCAASFKGDKSLEEIRENEQTNSLGTLTVAKLALQTGCKHFINISTIFSINPTTSYGLSKKHGDENLQYICELNNIKYTSILPSQIYDGKGISQKHQPLFYFLIKKASLGEDIILYGKEDPVRNFIFLSDVVQVVKRVVDNAIEGRFPCISLQSYPLSKLVEIIVTTLGSSSKIKWDTSKPSILSYEIPNNFSLYKLIGYYPETSLETGIKEIRKQWMK